MAKHVNLDALITREDFDTTDLTRPAGTRKLTLAINDLKAGEFFFSALRKPDFQRETSEWDYNKVVEFIDSFLKGNLIPAAILWQGAGFTFVIDGSHRLSSIAAWINDDYSDGHISKSFYDHAIPDEQIAAAVRARNLVNRELGSFSDHLLAVNSPAKVKPEIAERAKSLATLAIQLQWVEGDSSTAETSYVNINQKASPINATEMRVLAARRTPIGIAARAIVRSGKGHKYWSKFPIENQERLEQLANDVNLLLFHPKLPRQPLKTLDIPVAGEAYAALSLPLVLEFIELVNKTSNGTLTASDPSGEATIDCIARCKRVAELIDSSAPASLGLHPAVYFYSSNGRHKIASFLAVTALILDFEARNQFDKFTSVRGDFESLLIQHEYLIQQIVRYRRGALASFPMIKDFYVDCIESLDSGRSISETISHVTGEKKFGELIPKHEPEVDFGPPKFSPATKAKAFIKQALESALKCPICAGYLHVNAMTVDHIVPKREGGLSLVENAQITHPYCNTGYKEGIHAREGKARG